MERRPAADLLAYPVDFASWQKVRQSSLDETGIPRVHGRRGHGAAYHPTSIAQYALALWNAYLRTKSELDRDMFLAQARWLVTHEQRSTGEAGGWPIPTPLPEYYASGPWFSATTQGNALSVLVRAYQLTGDQVFLQVAQRAVQTFKLDTLDGGVGAPVGDEGVFFEEVAVYPAGHVLAGQMFALIGLYDYVALTGDPQISVIIEHGLATLHAIVDEFDTGYWVRRDQLRRRLASRFELKLLAKALGALSVYSGCAHCAALASRWSRYRWRMRSVAHFTMATRWGQLLHALWRGPRRLLFGQPCGEVGDMPISVCVPITGFPLPGGMRSVLAGFAEAMSSEWRMEYLTRRIGPHAENYIIHSFELGIRPFGSETTSPSQFPNVWFYVFAGWRKLWWMLRHGHRYHLILAQDGVYTGAFAALVGKIVGIRVVCVDHGNVTLLYSDVYRAERLQGLRNKSFLVRALGRARLALYWPSIRWLAQLAARNTDYVLAAGDDVAEAYEKRLGVNPSRIIRFPFMVDVERYAPPDAVTRADRRTRLGMASDAIVITMINRLAPEKGMHIAVQGIHQALATLSPDLRSRVRVVIGGDGPLRSQIEAQIREYGLEAVFLLWGEASPDDVVMLLSVSDIFLYTGLRGINSMAVLEAMAAGCAVIASTEPRLIARYLADGRGVAIPAGTADAVAEALARITGNMPLCHEMGHLAREYIATYHTAAALRRSILRATSWSPSISD